MNLAKEAREIISTLETEHFYAECPCCGRQVLMKDTDLFYLDDFTPEAEQLYQLKIEEIDERAKELRERRKAIPQVSEIGAAAVNIGFILERIAPSMQAFPFDHNDCRALFDPIDYVIFEGLSRKGAVDKIVFADIKTGGARLTARQKELRALVERQKVVWDTYETEAGK
jgi:predicted Holliday junction resolvase-like endonuclease